MTEGQVFMEFMRWVVRMEAFEGGPPAWLKVNSHSLLASEQLMFTCLEKQQSTKSPYGWDVLVVAGVPLGATLWKSKDAVQCGYWMYTACNIVQGYMLHAMYFMNGCLVVFWLSTRPAALKVLGSKLQTPDGEPKNFQNKSFISRNSAACRSHAT